MIVILKPSLDETSADYQHTLRALQALPQIQVEIHRTQGQIFTVIEIYLIGNTEHISKENIEALPGVDKVIKISKEYKMLGRNPEDFTSYAFEYNGVTFSQDNLVVFAGLCTVDNRETVKSMMQALKNHGQICTRMGAYKPRTSPYAFQGLGKSCLPYVFELAGNNGIKVIAMEVTHERQVEEIATALEMANHPTGVMLQIGTRNAQNFELLHALGSQNNFPILFKRGYGITLSESLHAAEYLAKGGNEKVIFCLRGVKSLFGSPHRNMVDFAHIPVIKRLTKMPVCIDPSHSVGSAGRSVDGISDIYHVTAQGVISGANMILVDFHPNPPEALVDSKQAISIDHLSWYLEDIAITRNAYLARKKLVNKG